MSVPERVAIVGSRGWRHDSVAVTDYVAALPEGTIIISGGAVGVDRAAEAAAECYGHICVVVKPAWKHGRKAGPERNAVIVDLADRVVAFWDGQSRGTASTIALARKAGKPVEVIR